MQHYCITESCNAFAVAKDDDYCPQCKGKLVTHCPKCHKPLGGHDKDDSRGCKHCGLMFKAAT